MHKSWKRRVEQIEPRVVSRLVDDVLQNFMNFGEPKDLEFAQGLLEQVSSGLGRMVPLLTGLNCVIPANDGSGIKSMSKRAEAMIEDLYRSGEMVVLYDEPPKRLAESTASDFVKELLDLASGPLDLNDLPSAKKKLRDVYLGLKVLASVVGSINDKSVPPDYLVPFKMSQTAEDILVDLILSDEIQFC